METLEGTRKTISFVIKDERVEKFSSEESSLLYLFLLEDPGERRKKSVGLELIMILLTVGTSEVPSNYTIFKTQYATVHTQDEPTITTDKRHDEEHITSEWSRRQIDVESRRKDVIPLNLVKSINSFRPVNPSTQVRTRGYVLFFYI